MEIIEAKLVASPMTIANMTPTKNAHAPIVFSLDLKTIFNNSFDVIHSMDEYINFFTTIPNLYFLRHKCL